MKLFSYGNIFFQIIQIKIGRFFTRIYIIYVNENLGKFFKDNKWNKQKGEEMFLETKSVFTKIQNSLPKNMKCRIFLKHTSPPWAFFIHFLFQNWLTLYIYNQALLNCLWYHQNWKLFLLHHTFLFIRFIWLCKFFSFF